MVAPTNHFNINFGTAIRDSSTQGSICQNTAGHIIKVISLISLPCDPTFRESLAALLAARLAVSLALKQFIMEGDSLTAALALHHQNITKDQRISSTISEILASIPASSS
jgi:hypothetical protein